MYCRIFVLYCILYIVEQYNYGLVVAKLCHTYFNLDRDLYLCFVYVPPSNSRYFNILDKDIFYILVYLISKYTVKGDVCIIGDLNARCGTRKYYLEDHSVLDHYFENIDSCSLPNENVERTV